MMLEVGDMLSPSVLLKASSFVIYPSSSFSTLYPYAVDIIMLVRKLYCHIAKDKVSLSPMKREVTAYYLK